MMTPSDSALSISQSTQLRPLARPHPNQHSHHSEPYAHQHYQQQASYSPLRRPLAETSHSPSSPSPTTSAAPMSIFRAREVVPPPLPPPNHLPDLSAGRDLGWQWANEAQRERPHLQSSVRAGSSLLGGHHSSEHYAGINSSLHPCERTGMISLTDDGMANYQLHGERHLEQRTREESLQTYDKQLLSRIGGPNTSKPLDHASSSSRDRTAIKPLVVTERPSLCASDSPRSISYRSVPPGPRSPGFSPSFAPMHWPSENGLLRCATTNHSANATRQGSVTVDDNHAAAAAAAASQRGSYDQTMFPRDDSMERDYHPLGSLHLHDRSPTGHNEDLSLGQRIGSKRRASSPPRDHHYHHHHHHHHDDRSSISSISGRSTIYLPTRTSPNARIHPSQSSFSSVSSFEPRHGSLGSSLGPCSMVSSATSYLSGRHSPTSCPVDVAETSPRTVGGSGGGLTHSLFICECCPKKPKKFETEEELRLHELEKQYTCAYCANRFKNKNEAERHQNSLHLRRHSWSCAALSTVEAAFHASPSGCESDLCGFCGQEFSNPPQWDVRAEHLNHVHKFGECNQSKKFFRADHFRQHLKHSHAGTSGKWTNMLENACMQEEALPEKRSTAASAPQRLMMNTALPTRSAHDTTGRGHLIPDGSTR